ncbi:hypothetical protein AEGHOMDF_6121 [Methylobacterium soli]|nr:hypothetical protein AEGHOMDF_6121 [Methylobacterium soli]
MAAGELVHAVSALAGIEHVGDQHGVVEGRHRDPVAREHEPVVFEVLADLEHARILEERLQQRQRLVEGDLAGQQALAEQVLAAPMRQRDVGGAPRGGGQRDADEAGAVGIERVGLGVDRDHARRLGLGDPGLQLRRRPDRLVGRRVEGLDGFGRARRHHVRGRRLGRAPRPGGRVRQVQVGEGVDLGGRLAVAALGSGRPGLGIGRHAVAEERHRVAAALRVGVAVRRAAGQEARVGAHGLGVDMQHLGDAARQGVELHRLEEADELLRVGRGQAQGVERHRDRHVLDQRHELARELRLIDVGEQRLAALGLLDLARPLQEGVEASELLDQGGGGLQADPGHARHVVGGVADQRQRVADLVRLQALPLGHDRVHVEVALGPVAGLTLGAGLEIVESHQGPDELHQVLVGGDDDDARAPRLGLARVGGDEVVGLVALQLHRVQPEGPHRLAHQRHLALEVVGRVRPVALVIGEHLLAERALGLVEDNAEMGRAGPGRALLHELRDLGAEQPHRAGGEPVRGPEIVALGLVDRLEIGPEDERRAVHQDDLVAGPDGLVVGGGRGGGGGGVRHARWSAGKTAFRRGRETVSIASAPRRQFGHK